MNREKRKQEVPGSEDNMWYIQIPERSLAAPKEKEKVWSEEAQPLFRSTLNIVYGPVLPTKEN